MPVTVTRKGQVTVPKAVRDHLGIKPGSKVVFEVDQDGRVLLNRAGVLAHQQSRFDQMRGTATTSMTTDEIMALVRGID
jgi:AbrB family looped-hinge helix DNA binding protein